MATPTAPKLLTAEEFALLPDLEDGSRMELVKGIVCMAPSPAWEHGDSADAIIAALRAFVRNHQLGRTASNVGFTLARNPDIVRAPDAAFVAGMAHRISGYFEGAPTLAVEVASPSDSEANLHEKVGEYLDAGAARVWVVRPANRTVTVYRHGGDVQMFREHETLSSDDAAFDAPGFTLPVAEIFA